MINFISIDSIVKDLLLTIRASKISQSETISLNQIEFWVHMYRALLIKQDIDKGKYPNPDYIQEIPAIKLELVDYIGDNANISSGINTYRTTIQLPKTIDLNYKQGITFVGTIEGDEIQLIPQSRSKWQKYRRYTDRNTIAFLRNQYVYIQSPNALSYITIRGIFEIPSQVNTLTNELTTLPEYSSTVVYPIPINWISVLKQMILKQELNIIVSSPSDNTNDGNNNVSSNVNREV